MNAILNMTGYQFVTLSATQIREWQQAFKTTAQACELKGTILLSEEGINLFLAGIEKNIRQFQQFLAQFTEFSRLTYRETWSTTQPFRRLLVRIKKEIISMGKAEIQPEQEPAPYLDPLTLKQWYQQGREMLVLDTRNHYEVQHGTFVQAIHLNLDHFRHFPHAIARLPAFSPHLPIVTYCTGGIRCEKAALWLQKQGYTQVYQLKGGILNYFEQCGRDYFQGECFVFDERMSV
jgi:UPF0176 protein